MSVHFLRFLPTCALLGGAALALTPPAGWVSAGSGLWRDEGGACLMREQSFDQTFPAMPSQQDALRIGNKLQAALAKQGMSDINLQPISQDTDWSVLLAYIYPKNGVNYQVVQLYLSQNNQLRTITGSSAQDATSLCVGVMRDFLKGR